MNALFLLLYVWLCNVHGIASYLMKTTQYAILMACAFSLCACGDGRVSPDEIEAGEIYVGARDPETGETYLREPTIKEKIERKVAEKVKDCL